MITIAPWHINDLQAALYRLLIRDDAPQQTPADHNDGRGYFETALVVDPLGSVFKMIGSKEDTNATMEDQKNL